MRRTPTFVLVVLATVLAGLLGTTIPASASTASRSADPEFTPGVYPTDITILPGQCPAEAERVRTARASHTAALRDYERYRNLRERFPGTYAPAEVDTRERALILAATTLNQALYDEAQCQLGLERPRRANATCTSLALELNRATALLQLANRRFTLAERRYDRAQPGNGGTGDELQRARTELEAAQAALQSARTGALLFGGIVAVVQRLGLCGNFRFQPVACNQPALGAEPATATASISNGEDGEATQVCVALDESAVPNGASIDTYDEWVVALDTLCDQDPGCGAAVLSPNEAI